MTPRTAKKVSIFLTPLLSGVGAGELPTVPISLVVSVGCRYIRSAVEMERVRKMPPTRKTTLKTPLKRIYNSASVPQKDCVFCKIVAGILPSYKVYEDSRHLAFLDINPFATGHTLVCPKKHGETLWDMDEHEIADVFKVASKVSMGVVYAMGADGFRIMQNNGEAANQAVAHIHVHVIPSKLEEKGKFSRLKLSEDEMARVADAIKSEIAGLP